ncbi:MAG: glycosyltransferase, partial [Nitrospiraceae bacterium]|nr:glycosyltransferase [Nitrospiraceae bacterium]
MELESLKSVNPKEDEHHIDDDMNSVEINGNSMEESAEHPMKKLFVCTDSFVPRWDGISRFLIELLPYLSKFFEVTVIAPNFAENELYSDYGEAFDFSKYGVNVIRIPIGKKVIDGYPVPRFKFIRIFHEISKADLVFTQTIGPIGMSSIIASAILKIPVIHYVHSVDWDLFMRAVKGVKLKKLFVRDLTKMVALFLFHFVSLMLVPSDEVAELLSKERVRKLKVIVPLGIHTEKFVPPVMKYKGKKKVGFDPDAFIIGYCGRLSFEKNLMVLYRAFKRLKRKYPGKVKLLVVGSGVVEINNKFKADNDVYFVGQKNDVIPYYQSMDVFVMPSLLETTSLVVLEAMSCGVPVISTKVGFAGRYFDEGKNGFLFNFHDEVGLYIKLDNLYRSGELY